MKMKHLSIIALPPLGFATVQNRGKVIVTIVCSTGERYLSTALGDQARQEVGA